MARVLLLGASGQVGAEALRLPLPEGWTLLAPSRRELDLAATDALAGAVEELAPDAIINAAAYTAVDAAEGDADAAYALNRDAPGALARAAEQLGIPIVHISTDYVFAGDKNGAYVEDDPIDPLGVYGASKAAGEAAIREACSCAAIVRTAWVFSPHRANFVKTMLRLGADRPEINVVADQHGKPTAAADIARTCFDLAQRLLHGDRRALGVFHYAGADAVTWADFAELIFARAAVRGGPAARVRRIATAEYPTPARRPANSVLDTVKIEQLGIMPRPLSDALDECLAQLLPAKTA